MKPLSQPLSNWEELLETARQHTPARRLLRVGQTPSTVPIPGGCQTLPDGDALLTSAPVLLFRDSNSWCPFCERVWFALEEKKIPFATEFIDLSNKPQWYLDLVPTALVPAAKIEGTLVHGSKAVLLALEAQFEPGLLPANSQERSIALQLIDEADSRADFLDDFLLLRKPVDSAEQLTNLKNTVEANLEQVEQILRQRDSPYFLSDFSLVDIMYSPLLDRLAANLPVYWGYAIKGNHRFPKLNAWFEALAQRPAYQRVKSDDLTNNLLLRRRYSVTPAANPTPIAPIENHPLHFRAEAAERLVDNRQAAIADVLRNSGVTAIAANTPEELHNAIEFYFRLLATYLLDSDFLLPWGTVGGTEPIDPIESAIGAVTLAYLRNRICAPRDMSAGAASAFRAAIDRVLTSLY